MVHQNAFLPSFLPSSLASPQSSPKPASSTAANTANASSLSPARPTVASLKPAIARARPAFNAAPTAAALPTESPVSVSRPRPVSGLQSRVSVLVPPASSAAPLEVVGVEEAATLPLRSTRPRKLSSKNLRASLRARNLIQLACLPWGMDTCVKRRVAAKCRIHSRSLTLLLHGYLRKTFL